MSLRCLSLIQPWAHLIVNGQKRIENRDWHLWSTIRPGEIVLVHASKTDAKKYRLNVHDFTRNSGLQVDIPFTLARGGIVGWMKIRGCLCPRDDGSHTCPVDDIDLRWWDPDQHGFVLDDAGPLPFVPMNGGMGFFEPPAAVVAELRPYLPPLPELPPVLGAPSAPKRSLRPPSPQLSLWEKS